MSYPTDVLATRYASKKIASLFSDEYKYSIWRELWCELAKAQKDAGLNITSEQIKLLEQNINNIDFNVVHDFEVKLLHEVMAHIHAYGQQVPEAKGIIHLGVTSAFVIDNGELIQMQRALKIIKDRCLLLMQTLSKFCMQHKDLVVLGYTHFQPAQPTTLGKRASLWLASIVSDYKALEEKIKSMRLRGAHGTTGSGASFSKLLNGDYNKNCAINASIAKHFGFPGTFTVVGQTYDRKVDIEVMNILESLACSWHKITNDLRLMQHLNEIDEPFSKAQVGSSAMPYKRNPMKSERISSLAKYVMSVSQNAKLNLATQWLERSLDDSANKRLFIAQSFLAVDGILRLGEHILSELNVYPKVIEKNLKKQLPFLGTEDIMMAATLKGADRQDVHEIIRSLSAEVSYNIKHKGLENNLVEKIINHKELSVTQEDIDDVLNIEKYKGFAAQQVEQFIAEEVQPILDANQVDSSSYQQDIKV